MMAKKIRFDLAGSALVMAVGVDVDVGHLALAIKLLSYANANLERRKKRECARDIIK